MFFEVVVVLLKKKYCPSCSQQSTIENFIEQTVIGSSSYIGFNISYSNKAAIIEFCSHRENAIISNLWLDRESIRFTLLGRCMEPMIGKFRFIRPCLNV